MGRVILTPSKTLGFNDWLRRSKCFWALFYWLPYHVYNFHFTGPGSTRVAETVRAFPVEVQNSPKLLKLIYGIFCGCSVHLKKCVKLLWNFLVRATLIIVFTQKIRCWSSQFGLVFFGVVPADIYSNISWISDKI